MKTRPFLSSMRTKDDKRLHEGLVACQEPGCKAKRDPDLNSLEELRAALEHWEYHHYMNGCSHGAI